MGRFLSLLGCYGVQERGGANDGEGWSNIDEGGKKTGGGAELIAGRSISMRRTGAIRATALGCILHQRESVRVT